MTSDFPKSLAFVLQMEGGFTDNPEDSGGATNYGITQSEYDHYNVSQGRSKESVRDITQADVETIYHNGYWNAVRGDYVAWPLCLVLFDVAVNNGVGRAYEFLNEGLGLGRVMEWTDETSLKYHALTDDDLRALADTILGMRRTFYAEIVANNPSQSIFLTGWQNRVTACKEACGLA